MTALISAELLRLRTVRGPRYTALALLVILPVLAALSTSDSAAARADGLRWVVLNVVIVAAAFAADAAGAEFKRGAVSLTYLRRPGRAAVTAAHALTHAALAGLLAVLVAAVTVATGLVAADARGVPVDLEALDVAGLVGATACGAAALAAAAVLLGVVTRSSSAAVTAFVGWLMAGNLLDLAGLGAGAYFPFGLVTALAGLGDDVAAPVAVVLLLAWLAALAVVVHRWGLPRDLT
jgi:hypothetical protein